MVTVYVYQMAILSFGAYRELIAQQAMAHHRPIYEQAPGDLSALVVTFIAMIMLVSIPLLIIYMLADRTMHEHDFEDNDDDVNQHYGNHPIVFQGMTHLVHRAATAAKSEI